MAHSRSYTFFQNMGRILKHKLIIPLIRSPHPPEYKAKGVAVGMAWAMTPLVGIQMWLVFVTWIVAKKIFKWSFSLPLALAYTWVSNVFTLVPIYYVFYVTGQIMRGQWGAISGYKALRSIIENTFLSDYTFLEKWSLFFKLLLKDWGVSMALGCLPWAVILGWGSYYITLRFEQARIRRRERKMMQRQSKDGTGF